MQLTSKALKLLVLVFYVGWDAVLFKEPGNMDRFYVDFDFESNCFKSSALENLLMIKQILK